MPTSWAWRDFCTSFLFRYTSTSSVRQTSCCMSQTQILPSKSSTNKSFFFSFPLPTNWIEEMKPYRWQTFVPKNIKWVNWSTNFSRRFVIYLVTLGRERLADIINPSHNLGIVAGGREKCMCRIWNQSMGPEKVSLGIHISIEF